MLTLVLAGLRHRAAALASVVVAAGLGAALIVLCGALFQTGIALAAPPDRVSGADLVVIGDPGYTMLDREGEPTTDHRPFPERHRLPGTVVEQAARIEGVERAVPIQLVETFARSTARAATLTGQNWASAAVSGLTGLEDARPGAGEVVLTAAAARALDVAAGDTLAVAVLGETVQARVTDVVGAPDEPATVFLGDGTVPSSEGVDALGIVLAAGAQESTVRDALDAGLAHVRVLAGDGRGAAEDPAVSASRTPTIVVGAVFGGIVLTVLATVVSGIVALTVRQRSREISLLRATGATGRQASALLVGEALLAGAVGALLGLALGVPLAHALFAAMRAGGVVPAGLELRVGVVPFAVAVATTLLIVWWSARLAARPARRSRAIDALREAELPRARIGAVRWVLGIGSGVGAIALAALSTLMPPALVSATAGPAVLAGAICAVLLAPAFLRLGLVLLRPVIGHQGGGLRGLARVNVRSRIAALSTVTGAAALVVGVGAGNLVSQAMLTTAAAQAQVETITADAVLAGPAGAAVERSADVSALPEVGAVSTFVDSGGWIERPYDGSHRDRPWPLRGLEGPHAAQVLSNDLVAGDLADLVGESVALPDRTAHDLGVGIDDTVHLRFGDGTAADLRVVATVDDLPGYEHLLLPADLLASHTTARAPATLLVSAQAGTSSGALLAALDSALADHPGVTVGDRADLESALRAGLDVNALINMLMLVVVLAYAMIAVINTVAVSTLGRRRELAMLRLAGGTRRQVRTLILTETALAAATGLVAGLVVACAAVVPTAVVVGASPLTVRPVAILLALGVAVALITLPITAVAGRRAMSGRPADALASTV
jgi:putative ABC transport system permease protein